MSHFGLSADLAGIFLRFLGVDDGVAADKAVGFSSTHGFLSSLLLFSPFDGFLYKQAQQAIKYGDNKAHANDTSHHIGVVAIIGVV